MKTTKEFKTIILLSIPKPYLNNPNAQCPIGLQSLAAILDQNKVSCDIKNYAELSLAEAINDLAEAKCYGITTTSLELLEANRFAKLIKQKYPQSKIILGGPGTYSDEYIDWNVIDSICKGEGEITILKIIDDLYKNKLKRIYIGEIVKDLNTLPFPARHYLKSNLGGNIFAFNKQYYNNSSTVIISSRGCAFNCSFCAAPKFSETKCVRFRNPINVYEEIKDVIKKYNIKQFRFSDDSFTLNRNNVLEFCKLIKPLNIHWRISCRVKPLDEEMLQSLQDAGCHELSLGIESFDDRILKIFNKKTTVEDNIRALRLAHKIGLKTRVLLMVRTPGQDKETLRINKYYLERLPYTIIACTSFVPIPGSDIAENPDKYNIEILSRNLDDYNFYFFGPQGKNELKPIFKIKNRSLEEFHRESEEFRDWLVSQERLNKG